MSFDARSRERLEALGRQLPQKLPSPAPAAPTPQANPAPQGRHPLELERNPEQLFRELMRASADGTVPPHLIDRLRPPGPRRVEGADAELYTSFQQLLLEDEELD